MNEQNRYEVRCFYPDGSYAYTELSEWYQDTYEVSIPLGGHAVIQHIGGGRYLR